MAEWCLKLTGLSSESTRRGMRSAVAFSPRIELLPLPPLGGERSKILSNASLMRSLTGSQGTDRQSERKVFHLGSLLRDYKMLVPSE